jgi:hypothetical protein
MRTNHNELHGTDYPPALPEGEAMTTASHVITNCSRLPNRYRTLQAVIELDPRAASLRLKKHQHLQFRSLAGWIIHAADGILWITQDGDRRDVVLEPGETFRIDHETPVVIGALSDADVALCRARVVSVRRASNPFRRLLAPWPQVYALFA